MQKIIKHAQTRTLGLLPTVRLVAVVRSYAADGLMLRWRRVPAAQSNFGYQRKRENNHV